MGRHGDLGVAVEPVAGPAHAGDLPARLGVLRGARAGGAPGEREPAEDEGGERPHSVSISSASDEGPSAPAAAPPE